MSGSTHRRVPARHATVRLPKQARSWSFSRGNRWWLRRELDSASRMPLRHWFKWAFAGKLTNQRKILNISENNWPIWTKFNIFNIGEVTDEYFKFGWNRPGGFRKAHPQHRPSNMAGVRRQGPSKRPNEIRTRVEKRLLFGQATSWSILPTVSKGLFVKTSSHWTCLKTH